MPELDAPAPAWSLPKRIAFRFALIYFVLYALPFPFQNLWQLFTGSLSQFWEIHAGKDGWEWLKPVNRFFYGDPQDADSWGPYNDMWRAMTSWLGWKLDLDVVHQRTGSGDTAHALLKLVYGASFAVIGTVVWSWFGRRQEHHARLAKWLHLGARWYLAFVFLGYGMIKFYSGQFSYPSLHRLMNPVGETSPMGMVWTFMGLSKPYEMASGAGETLGALLLFSRRTSLVGCFVLIGVASNIVMLNWLFDVPVKLFSSNLLLMTMALLAPDAKRLLRVFVLNRDAPRADLSLVRRPWSWVIGIFGLLWVGTHLYNAHNGYMKFMERRAVDHPALYGIWDVEKHVRDGAEVPRTDVTRWKLVAIDVGDRAWIRTITDRPLWLHCKNGEAENTLSVAPMRGRKPPAEMDTWTVEQSKKTVKGRHPAPKRMSDFRERVDLKRRVLVLRGSWDGKPIEVHLLKREFPLQRGFHLIQELPFNR